MLRGALSGVAARFPQTAFLTVPPTNYANTAVPFHLRIAYDPDGLILASYPKIRVRPGIYLLAAQYRVILGDQTAILNLNNVSILVDASNVARAVTTAPASTPMLIKMGDSDYLEYKTVAGTVGSIFAPDDTFLWLKRIG